MWQAEVSHKSEMAGPFNRGDTIINKHFTFFTFYNVCYHGNSCAYGLHTSFKTVYLISNAFVNTGCGYVGYVCSLCNCIHIKFTETWSILEILLLASFY